MSKLVSLSLFFLSTMAQANLSTKSIREGHCDQDIARVTFSDGLTKGFAPNKNYKCEDFKISSDKRYAGWKSIGTVTLEDGPKKSYPDAVLYVLIQDKTYAVTENSRYIRDWFFVKERPEVMAETSFEHGPSTFILFNLASKRKIEACQQTELERCPQLKKIIDQSK